MSEETVIPIRKETNPTGGNNGGSGDRDVYLRLGKLEGQMKHLATKANVWQALFVGIISLIAFAIGLFKWMVQPFFQTLLGS